jgi:hypothetical protein
MESPDWAVVAIQPIDCLSDEFGVWVVLAGMVNDPAQPVS